MRNFLDINAIAPSDLRAIIDSARSIKEARAGRPKAQPDDVRALDGRMVALIFEKPSTRTRVSFDVGVRQMGGETMVLSGGEMQLGHGETVADTARVMSRYVDLIMIRTFKEENACRTGRKCQRAGDQRPDRSLASVSDHGRYSHLRGGIAARLPARRSSGRATATMSAPRSFTPPASSVST